MKAFVTGGTGVVGKAFLPRLAQAGYEITALTRDPRKADLPRDVRITYVAGNLDAPETVAGLFSTPAAYDIIFHLAASLEYFGDVEKMSALNAGGTATMARFARHAGAQRFVHASSIEAAGGFAGRAIPAAPGDVGRVISTYGESKRAAEAAALALNASGLPAISLRIGNVYGDGWPNFVVEFADAILQRNRLAEFLPIYAGRYWSPVHNDDVSAGLLAAAGSSHTGLCNLVGQAATVGEIFQMCASAVGVHFAPGPWRLTDWLYVHATTRYFRRFRHFDTLAYLAVPTWPYVHRCFGMEESSRALAWSPSVALRLGIERTIRWAREAGLLRF